MAKLKNQTFILLALASVFFVAVQAADMTGLLNPYYKLNLILIGINIILAVSLNLINGFTGQFSIGHAGFMAVGAYTSAVLTMKIFPKLGLTGIILPLGFTNIDLMFLVALLAGALAAALAGFLIGLPTLRLKGDYLAIATLGFGEIIRVIIINIEYIGGAAGFNGISQKTNWTVLFFLTVATVLIIRNFINSTHGRACISVRENEIAAETMGINTTKYKVMAFTFGAFFAGIAGALHAHYFYTIQPGTFNFLKSFDILVMVVLGGMGSITGSILAAVLLTILSAALQDLAALRMVIYALALILLMIFRPQGLMGNKEFSLQVFARLMGKNRDMEGKGAKEGGTSIGN